MKHPGYFASIGLPVEDRLVALLKKNDLDSATAPVFVQCFEVTPLKTIRAKTKARLVLLTAGEGGLRPTCRTSPTPSSAPPRA